ncbi:MAG: glycosyltransferase [Bacteroidetes bacterium]|nr:glycosyltransferase [Bacteroidota bacterium]
MLEVIFLIFFSLYFIQSIVFLIGAFKKYPKLKNKNLPSASVLVAARNEEHNILDCLESLDNIVYPEGKLEIIIVDDNSEDSTSDIVDKYISGKEKFKLLRGTTPIGSLKGKANAIANGIKLSKNEIILTTDADCKVSTTWASTLASYFTKDVAMVCGYTHQSFRNAFEGMQSLDFIYLLEVAGGTMNFNRPLSCIGNNMSYRKDVYDEVGGYEAIPFSVTEDFKMLMAIHDLKKYKIIYPIDEGGLVESKPCEDFKSLYWQKKRWGVGGLDSELIGLSVMGTGMITNLLILFSPLFFSLNVLYLIIAKIFTDYFFLQQAHKKLKLPLTIKNFIAFELYFIFYVIALPTLLIFSKSVRWKGRKY